MAILRGLPNNGEADLIPMHRHHAQPTSSSPVFITRISHPPEPPSLHYLQERTVEGVGDGIVEGGAAFGMGIYRGFTGLVTKPVEGAKSKGVGGE